MNNEALRLALRRAAEAQRKRYDEISQEEGFTDTDEDPIAIQVEALVRVLRSAFEPVIHELAFNAVSDAHLSEHDA